MSRRHESYNDYILDEKAKLPGRRYSEEKPWSCVYCYFWDEKDNRCKEKRCYYLLKEKKVKKQNSVGDCKTCPYGKHMPCIGYCIAKLQSELRRKG